MTITERIFLRLSEIDLSQKEFAIKIGANEKTVSAWKKNGTTPSADYIYPISQLLGVSLEYLLIGEEATVNNSISTGDITGSYNANITTTNTDSCTEFEKEFSSVLSGLSFRERTELMTMIYKFADEHKKN